jgi:phenylalanyl-tRNA synthetase alpha chain
LAKVADDLERLLLAARAQIAEAPDSAALEQIRVALLGKKGSLTAVLRGLGSLPAQDRARTGERANAVKKEVEEAIAARAGALEEARRAGLAEREWLDVTFIPKDERYGHLHPLTLIMREIRAVFARMGYAVALGPEVEDEWHNFEALNIPAGHPARDDMDSFYVGSGELLLRTHTSPVQIRYMEQHQPPIRIIVPGRTYRRDYDATHLPQFNQVEGLAVDTDIRLSDLKGTLEYFARSIFGSERKIRLTGDHFRFTEPSVGVAVSCGICGGSGCSSCKRGWLEILGAGMVHPQVLRNGGIDPGRYSGFAFGMGADRIAMLKYNLPDIRSTVEPDVRFLRQF